MDSWMVESVEVCFSDSGLALVEDRVPESAASRLKGSELEEPREAKGGSMRVNGAEIRLFLPMLAIFRLGLRPAGAVNGALGLDVLAFTGVDNLLGTGGGGMLFDVAKLKFTFEGFPVPFLLFFAGELKVAGSTFSPSLSSKIAGSKERLTAGLDGVRLFFPFKGEGLEMRPEQVSTRTYRKP